MTSDENLKNTMEYLADTNCTLAHAVNKLAKAIRESNNNSLTNQRGKD